VAVIIVVVIVVIIIIIMSFDTGIFSLVLLLRGAWVSVVVKALRY
jgi:hypothetical protein